MFPYASLNLGDHVGDDPVSVAFNRAMLQAAIQTPTVFLSQVHGVRSLDLRADTPHGSTADACFTQQSRLACTIMVADCLPVLLTNAQGSLVAAAHAGWRGLAGQGGRGILEASFESFYALDDDGIVNDAHKIIAWLGPCIGPEAFEVGSDVRDAFLHGGPSAAAFFKKLPNGQWLADLPGLARLKLAALGVSAVYGNDGSEAWCTVKQPSRFFSHRRDAVSGRMAACIWLD